MEDSAIPRSNKAAITLMGFFFLLLCFLVSREQRKGKKEGGQLMGEYHGRLRSRLSVNAASINPQPAGAFF
jgi:hypothetical protein